MRVSPASTQVTAPLWASTASFLSEELDKTISAAPLTLTFKGSVQ